MPDFNTVFDFIDYLEGLNRQSGTANENRAFIFNTITDAIVSGFTNEDLYNAYNSVGITIPETVFDKIVENRQNFSGAGDIIQFLAPTSQIPSFDLPEYTGKFLPDEDFITYYNVTYIEPITGDTIQKQGQYLKYSDVLTPSELRSTISQDFSTRYKAQVLSVDMRRTYQTLTA